MWSQKSSQLYNQILNLKKHYPKCNGLINVIEKALYDMLTIALHYQKNKSQIYQKAVSNIKEKIFNLEYALEVFCKKANDGDLNAFDNLDIITKKIIDLYDELESLEQLLLEEQETDYKAIIIQFNNFTKQKERKVNQILQKVVDCKKKIF